MTEFIYSSDDDAILKNRFLKFRLWLIEKFGELEVNAGWDIDALQGGMYDAVHVLEEFKQRFPTEDELLYVETAKVGDNQIWYIDKRVRKELGSGHLKTRVFMSTRVFQIIVVIPDDIDAVEFRLAMS
jgi:hypothetical protein